MSFPKITSKKQYEISSEWNQYFPEMVCYKPMLLVNRLGPLLIGVCLEIKSSKDRYYPRLFLYNMARLRNYLAFDLSIKKNSYIITTKSEESKQKLIATELRDNKVIPVAGEVYYGDLVKKIKKFCQESPGSDQLAILRMLFYLAGWTGIDEFKEDILCFCQEVFAIGKISFTDEKRKEWIKKNVDDTKDLNILKNNVRMTIRNWQLEEIPYREILFNK